MFFVLFDGEEVVYNSNWIFGYGFVYSRIVLGVEVIKWFLGVGCVVMVIIVIKDFIRYFELIVQVYLFFGFKDMFIWFVSFYGFV